MPLYALGSNSCHQLSFRHTNDVWSPCLTTLNLPADESPVKIVGGGNHTLLLTNRGNLYATGANKYGQCIRPACEVIPGFVCVDGRWRDCAATWEGSVAIREDGLVFSFGKTKDHSNMDGVHVEDTTYTADLKESNNRLRCDEGMIIHVSGGFQHFIIFGELGALGYGNGRKGQFSGKHVSETITVNITTSDVIQATSGK